MSGTLYVVATPIGNLEDMTMRAIRVLREADVIAAEDTRSAAVLLGHFGIGGVPVRSLFEGNEAARTEELLTTFTGGGKVAVISEAGTPAVSDPGQRLVAACVDAGIRVEVVPGPSAVITALVGSGLPTQEFRFIGFPPREAGPRQQVFGALRSDTATLVLYEAPDRVGATLADLRDALGATRRAVLARELTKKFEEYVRGPLGELADRYRDQAPRGECSIVVEGGTGDVAVDVEAEMRALLAEGLGPKDAAARLVVKTGKPRRELYQLALALKRER